MFDQIFSYVSKRQTEFGTAMSVLGQLFYIISFETFAMVFCEKFNITGIVAGMIYIAIPFVGLIIIIAIGHLMIRTGYQKAVAEYGSNINKDWVKLIEDTKEIRKLLNNLLDKRDVKMQEPNEGYSHLPSQCIREHCKYWIPRIIGDQEIEPYRLESCRLIKLDVPCVVKP
jgi:hypothetical protein